MRYGLTIRDPGPSSVLPMAYAQVMPRLIYISAIVQWVRYPVSLRSVQPTSYQVTEYHGKTKWRRFEKKQMELYTVSSDIFRPFCCL